MDDEIIQRTADFVRSELEGEGSGHDWWHIERVTKMTRRIASEEGADEFICTMAALLHDVADEKLNDDLQAAEKKVEDWLKQLEIDESKRLHIIDITKTISFKGGNGAELTNLEAQVVQDADRLDAIGAIGIARCFTYAGSVGNIIHNPVSQPRESMTHEEYRSNEGTTINHFYEKLLKLKDLMNTKIGYEIAKDRHEYMEQFLAEFFDEWQGKK
ncbi:HD domain-containing protein [Filobacillus milosensis]|uniref:HD domain-containing protein n=1 Tax=Filobacillus milosensis TaxID=94137 RepID=A0A4Y8INJ7_9BACI|nr:HD domain-containing protein [Filobacillus milosensis]TFB21809.1 HD domain-containing protein [Filobacillus milosensis]